MKQQDIGRVERDADVDDREGKRIDTVAYVYRELIADHAHGGFGQPYYRDMVEVRTGLFGLGRHLHLPLSAIARVEQGCVFLAEPRDVLRSRYMHGVHQASPAHR